MGKQVYFFGAGKAEGNTKQKDLLGGKGAGLAEMANLGIPVPPGFTLTTEVCVAFMRDRKLPAEVHGEVERALAEVEKIVGMKFGDPSAPLLVSVRSGARASMPGMMDTILNLGLNDITVEGLATRTNNPRFAYDAYRRFIAMYGGRRAGRQERAVRGTCSTRRAAWSPASRASIRVDERRSSSSAPCPTHASTRAPPGGVTKRRQKRSCCEKTGKPFPSDPQAQLWGAIEAVFR